MTNETTKTKALLLPYELELLEKGQGIDIGCASDPITGTCRLFDKTHGDANDIEKYVSEKFDYVYSSHCLEDMDDPRKSIRSWWTLVKPGGHLFLVVPDEDLYEQGFFPSRFNPSHKWTFTINKYKSWSPNSINLLPLLQNLPNAEVLRIELQDNNYNRILGFGGVASIMNNKFIRRPIRFYKRLRRLGIRFPSLEELAGYNNAPIDQTLQQDVLAQIFSITRKRTDAHKDV